jgi:hypothetical protein
MTTITHRPSVGALAETAAGTATVIAFMAGVAVGYLHRYAAPLALLALAVTLARSPAYRPGHR